MALFGQPQEKLLDRNMFLCHCGHKKNPYSHRPDAKIMQNLDCGPFATVPHMVEGLVKKSFAV